MQEILINIRYEELDYGHAVEYNDENEIDYVNYVLKVWAINKNYLDSLFNKAEIIKRR